MENYYVALQRKENSTDFFLKQFIAAEFDDPLSAPEVYEKVKKYAHTIGSQYYPNNVVYLTQITKNVYNEMPDCDREHSDILIRNDHLYIKG